MWPWETEPHSIAHGILDDETYDWAAVIEAMLTTGGRPVVVSEELLGEANALGRESTEIPVDPTGSSGLAGLLALRQEGVIGDDERVAVLFTGVDRSHDNHARRRSHEELSRPRHPVAQGI
jgi:threonine synthase